MIRPLSDLVHHHGASDASRGQLYGPPGLEEHPEAAPKGPQAKDRGKGCHGFQRGAPGVVCLIIWSLSRLQIACILCCEVFCEQIKGLSRYILLWRAGCHKDEG